MQDPSSAPRSQLPDLALDNREDMMRHFPKRLARWQGARARLWTLIPSHPVLTILLTKDDAPSGLMIYCGSPERIEAPRHWANSNIKIEFDTKSFRVVDREAKVLISECSVGLQEFKRMDWDPPDKPGLGEPPA